MPGDPTAWATHTYSGSAGMAGSGAVSDQTAPMSPGHWGFIFWLVVLGVVVPAAILGGLQVGGFSFVFRHR